MTLESRSFTILASAAVVAVAVAVAVALPAPAGADYAGPICGPREAFYEQLRMEYAEHRASVLFSEKNRIVYEVWRGEDSWTILAVAGDGKACVVDAGNFWMAYPEPAKGRELEN